MIETKLQFPSNKYMCNYMIAVNHGSTGINFIESQIIAVCSDEQIHLAVTKFNAKVRK
ncbi:hypothetical protein BH09BAC2_BH09BAC2_20510 [soil metagenome]